MKSAFVVILISLFAFQSWAAIDKRSITLKEALQKGMDYSLELKQSDSSIKEARAELNKVRGKLFPEIKAVGGAKATQGSVATSSTAAGSIAGNVVNNYSAAVELVQPLYVGGAITGGLSYYKAGEDLARQRFFSSKQQVVYNIINSFYSLAQAQQTLAESEQNRDILKAYLDVIGHYTQIGRSRKIDQMQAQVNLSLAIAAAEQIRNNMNNYQSNLNRYIGADVSQMIQTDFKAVISSVGDLSTSTAFDAALRNNPDIRIAQIKLEQLSYSEDLDLSQDKPSVNLVGSYGYSAPESAGLFNSNAQTYTVGVNLVVPIFSGLSSISKRQSYSEKKYQAEKDLQIAKDEIRSRIENVLHSVRSALNQVDMAITSDKHARAGLELANKSFKQGVASSLDVVNLQRARSDSGKLLIDTQFNYLQAVLQLRQLMGIDLEKAYAK